jgi:hypothetical protein
MMEAARTTWGNKRTISSSNNKVVLLIKLLCEKSGTISMSDKENYNMFITSENTTRGQIYWK